MPLGAKDALKWTLGLSSLDVDGLMTTLCDVEALINSRPLTHVEDDPNELPPLLLTFCWESESSPCRRAALQKRIDLGGLTSSLPEAYQCGTIRMGDTVIVHEENTCPTFWKLGRVLSLHPGQDGFVRACSVRLATGRVVNRPVQKLYALEQLDIHCYTRRCFDPRRRTLKNKDTRNGLKLSDQALEEF
ncbi:hypothetical protein HPB50_006833 [Hyalomma asiaticum]|uniref:Uncharacterized protein n=1 Tax=Hyalomma asiaticum TaxID=266040 RepID=A0ACB7T1I7_HYAAI|nr:hypothetical protein HPB50_006833 [Hyalomma asiaticum]